MPPLGRKVTDLAQKTKGRQALRFQLELIPYFLDEVPTSVKQACFMWERGAKLQYTEPSPVNVAERSVYWGNTLLKQTATMYKEGDNFVGKDYLFKVQSVNTGSEKRSTFAKTKIDLAKYCSCDSNDAREVYIPLKPTGTLRISIQATWLRHSSPENDTMTEISAMSLGRSGTSSLEEQDLSGFHHDHHKQQHQQQPFQPTRVSGRFREALESPFKSKSNPTVSSDGVPLKRGVSSLPSGLPAGPSSAVSGNRRKANFQDVDLHNGPQSAAAPVQAKPSRPPPPPPAAALPRTRGRSSAELKPAPVLPGYSSKQSAPAVAIPPDDYDKILNESYATLLTSDSEDDEGGMVATAKRWWTTSAKKDAAYRNSNLRPQAASGAASPPPEDIQLHALNKEDLNSLRLLCKQALRERDQEQMLRQQAERRARHLQSDCEALAMSKSMLVERLREAEDRLMTMRQDETMNALVQAKIKLAQADYANLELQGHLSSERERVRFLKLRLTDLEAAYHATLDSLDRLQLPDAPGTPDHSFTAKRR